MKSYNRLTGLLFFLLTGTLHTPAQNISALQPLYSEAEALIDDRLVGRWQVDVFGKDTLSIERIGDNFYHIFLPFHDPSPDAEAVLTRTGDVFLIDLYPVTPDSILTAIPSDQFVRTHSFHRISIRRDTVLLADMSYRWFIENVVRKHLPVDHAWSDVNPVLTGTTDEIRQFISANAADNGFFGKDVVLTRVPPEPAHPDGTGWTQAPPDSEMTGLVPISHQCPPTFSHQDGWFGGDGDVSVSLGPGAILWLFADSFVGEEHQTTRQGATMIPNSVAVMQCSRDGEPSIRYYWRNAGTSHPEPIFQSRTTRYKYWPEDAFMIGDDLYVVLSKIGPLVGAAPDELFNFKHLGLTLAKIRNPRAATPDRWNIELFPWSPAFGLLESPLKVVDGNYLYFYVRDDSRRISMTRLPLESIEMPEGHIERLTEKGGWSVDVPKENRKILFTGTTGNSISYYEDVKKWIMVCGPGFLTNKIRVRTAPELDGPWSAETVVFECPEQTPGSPLYDRDNFCYSGRAHKQFYDSKTKTLLLTYDWNVSDPSKLLSNPDIYTPRVIRIPIPE